MTEPHDEQPIEQRLDKELSLRGILGFGFGILVLIAVAGALSWGFATMKRSQLKAQDPPPPALLEARAKYEPPGPHLQARPTEEYDRYRAEQEVTLTSWGWVDEAAGVARVPVERAIDLALENGLQPAAPAEPATEAEPAAETGSDAESPG